MAVLAKGPVAVAVLNGAPAERKLGLKIGELTAGLDAVNVSWRLLPVGLLLGGGVGLVRIFRRERLSVRWFAGFAGLTFANFMLVGAVVLPMANPLKAPLGLIPEVQQRLAPGQPICLYGYQLAIIPFYVERRGASWRRRRRSRRCCGGTSRA